MSDALWWFIYFYGISSDLLFFSELKRRLKAEQKAKEKAEKQQAVAAAAPAAAKPAKINDDDIDPTVRADETGSHSLRFFFD